jgi:hypothetical protein
LLRVSGEGMEFQTDTGIFLCQCIMSYNLLRALHNPSLGDEFMYVDFVNKTKKNEIIS